MGPYSVRSASHIMTWVTDSMHAPAGGGVGGALAQDRLPGARKDLTPLCPLPSPLSHSDDFISTQMRRGRGGGSAAVFTQPLSGAFAQGLDSAQYTDPSAGWRNDIDGVAQIANKLWLSACCA
jgi:hypothetical protein